MAYFLPSSCLVQRSTKCLHDPLQQATAVKRMQRSEYSQSAPISITATNTDLCAQTTLTYNCLCSNGSAPTELPNYIDSMPYRICQKSYDLCIQAHPNDQLGQDGCTNNIRAKCGTLKVENFTAPATTSTAASSSSATAVATTTAAGGASGTASGTAASATATKSSAAMLMGSNYGTGIIAAGAIALFGFML
jgi:hypothetical protein